MSFQFKTRGPASRKRIFHRRADRFSFTSRYSATALPYRSRGALLSQGEAAFFRSLMEAVGGDYQVMCKVRLADVVTCPVRRDRRGPFSAISQKHIDFVLCERETTRFALAVELDDRSHERPGRQRRDRFVNDVLAMAGIRLLRVRALSRYSASNIRRSILSALNGAPGALAVPHATSFYESDS